MQQVALGLALVEQPRPLGDIGIDPDADVQPLGFQPGEHAFRIGEATGSHSKSHQCWARIQKQSKWKTCSGMSRSRMPSTKPLTVFSSYSVVNEVVSHRPKDHAGGRAGRPVSRGVAIEHVFRRRSVDQKIGERLAFDGEADLRDELGTDLEGDPIGLVDQHAPAAVGQEEGNVLVGLFGRRAAVAIPDLDHLAVAGEGGEAFAEPVDQFADAEVEAFEDIGLAGHRR